MSFISVQYALQFVEEEINKYCDIDIEKLENDEIKDDKGKCCIFWKRTVKKSKISLALILLGDIWNFLIWV